MTCLHFKTTEFSLCGRRCDIFPLSCHQILQARTCPGWLEPAQLCGTESITSAVSRRNVTQKEGKDAEKPERKSTIDFFTQYYAAQRLVNHSLSTLHPRFSYGHICAHIRTNHLFPSHTKEYYGTPGLCRKDSCSFRIIHAENALFHGKEVL